MEIITMESEAYQSLVASIKRIERHIMEATAEVSDSDNDVWIGTKEACKIAGVSERTMQSYRANGIIDYKHCGKFCRYRISDVKSLIAQGYGNRKGNI